MGSKQIATGLSSHELADLVGITFRQLDFWVSKGYLPTVASEGPGKHRRWHVDEVVRLSKIAGLVDIGFLPERAVELLDSKAVGR